jgi:aminocarboxymuconate-semialdehyde decarboxylase
VTSIDLVDVHAHWLPASHFGLPPGSPFAPMQDREGRLHLGDLPLSIATEAMSDVDAVYADMDAQGIGVRALSPPPFAFPTTSDSGADDYIGSFNVELAGLVANSGGRLAGLGLVRLDDADAGTKEMTRLASEGVVSGVAIPPLVGSTSLDTGVLRDILRSAARLDLAVLVHPMQLPRPEWSSLYLANLIGNPVETATAVAGAVLGGVLDELPSLRVCFVHGGGCAPALLGRWSHAWGARPDVHHTDTHPRDAFRQCWFDTVTHDVAALTLLREHASSDHVLCGTDYPFDMAESAPSAFLESAGVDRRTLHDNGLAFLGGPRRGTEQSAAASVAVSS